MTKGPWFLALLIAVVISLGLFTLKGFGKEENYGSIYDIRALSEKIGEVLKNQQDIIARLEDIREQQDVIRVRASRR